MKNQVINWLECETISFLRYKIKKNRFYFKDILYSDIEDLKQECLMKFFEVLKKKNLSLNKLIEKTKTIQELQKVLRAYLNNVVNNVLDYVIRRNKKHYEAVELWVVDEFTISVRRVDKEVLNKIIFEEKRRLLYEFIKNELKDELLLGIFQLIFFDIEKLIEERNKRLGDDFNPNLVNKVLLIDFANVLGVKRNQIIYAFTKFKRLLYQFGFLGQEGVVYV